MASYKAGIRFNEELLVQFEYDTPDNVITIHIEEGDEIFDKTTPVYDEEEE